MPGGRAGRLLLGLLAFVVIWVAGVLVTDLVGHLLGLGTAWSGLGALASVVLGVWVAGRVVRGAPAPADRDPGQGPPDGAPPGNPD